MERQCDHCGTTFTAKRSTAKFCSASCRVGAHTKRQRLGAVVEMPTARSSKKATGQEAEPAGVAVVVREQLEKADRLGTYAGQQALVLARRLDGSAVDSGAAVAALSKELDRLMGPLLAGTEEPDELDAIVGEVVQIRTRRRG